MQQSQTHHTPHSHTHKHSHTHTTQSHTHHTVRHTPHSQTHTTQSHTPHSHTYIHTHEVGNETITHMLQITQMNNISCTYSVTIGSCFKHYTTLHSVHVHVPTLIPLLSHLLSGVDSLLPVDVGAPWGLSDDIRLPLQSSRRYLLRNISAWIKALSYFLCSLSFTKSISVLIIEINNNITIHLVTNNMRIKLQMKHIV